MADTPKIETAPAATSKWVYVVIVLVAIIGLLAGLLISKASTPAPEIAAATQIAQTYPTPSQQTDPVTQPGPPGGSATQNDVRRILRNLEPTRRREILDKASKNLNITGDNRPRVLMQKRRQARERAMEMAQADNLDVDALRDALNEVHKINGQIAEQGTQLTLEVLQLMTPEERKAATQRRFKTRRERIRERREQRRERQRD